MDGPVESPAQIDEASQPYVGRWNRLVSTTNWEKGRIIHEWRTALIEEDAPAADYSDEAWSRKVGAVTGQHAGRLRRVYDRFGAVTEQFEGLYWSHFQAALDWDDAEMWLEGALQNSWSVSNMRRQRWETLGAIPEQQPRDEDIVATDVDEDFQPSDAEPSPPDAIAGSIQQVQDPRSPAGPDFGDEEDVASKSRKKKQPDGESGASIYAEEDESPKIDFVRPFENLGELPDDLTEAFEAFKLAILRHKTDDWQQVSRDDVLASLDALKELALAPAASKVPF